MRKRLKIIRFHWWKFLALLQAEAPSCVIVLKLQRNMLRWRRSEKRSAAWKLPCTDSGTKNYPPLPGNRLKISRELNISTKYPNLLYLVVEGKYPGTGVLLHPPITRGGAELNYYSWAGVTVPIPDRAEFQICHLPQVLILQRWDIDTSLLQTLQWISRHTSQDIRLHFNIRTFHLTCTCILLIQCL